MLPSGLDVFGARNGLWIGQRCLRMLCMLTPDQLRFALLRVNVRDIAAASRVSDKTIYRIRQGRTQDPGGQTMLALCAAIERIAPSVLIEAGRTPAMSEAIAASEDVL